MRMTYPYVAEDEDFVGFGKDIKELVHVLVNEDDKSFVSICGMGGSGKTTLAQKIYNHPNVKGRFDSFAWVCISQQWQKRDILQGILVSFLPDKRKEIKDWRDSELVEQLLRFQQDKKCLVVLDDIWSTDAWECIKVAFPIQKKGNKILLTTRNNNVAVCIGQNGFHHEPRLLSHLESWELLKKKALRGRPSQEYESVQGMGKEMVKFCGGLPLAVVILGGILATKHSFDEWNAVYRNVKSYLGKGESIEQHQGEVEKILALSYNDLPYKLKPCFLYLSVFPEDEEIEADSLYLLWMAEGMVFAEDRIGDESMLDIAERYLSELAKRCIVRVKIVQSEFISIRKFYSCRIHDLMRDMCLAKAREEQFMEVIDCQNTNYDVELVNSSGASSSSGNFHRIAIYLREQEAQKYVPPKMEAAKNLRAFLFCVKDQTTGNLIAQLVDSQLNRFKMLRSLTVEGLITPGLENLEETNSFPGDIFKLPIGHLIHLRYLSLRRSRLVISPSSMSKLEHLETLDLWEAKIAWSKNLPLRMRRLRYLNVYYLENYYNNLQIDASSSLEILVGFNSGMNVVIRNFSELTNLRELETMNVNNPNDVEEIIKCISNSQRMKYAIVIIGDVLEIGTEFLAQLFSSCLQYLGIRGRLGKLPKYDSHFLGNLLELGLISSFLEEDPMEILEKLPNLQRLLLYVGAFAGKEMVCHSMGFSQLRFLKLDYLRNLEKWTVEEGAMANLSRLEINGCKRLPTIPEGLRYIKSLKELVIETMPQEFKDRIRVEDGQEGEDFDIVCHIPSIIFK